MKVTGSSVPFSRMLKPFRAMFVLLPLMLLGLASMTRASSLMSHPWMASVSMHRCCSGSSITHVSGPHPSALNVKPSLSPFCWTSVLRSRSLRELSFLSPPPYVMPPSWLHSLAHAYLNMHKARLNQVPSFGQCPSQLRVERLGIIPSPLNVMIFPSTPPRASR